MNYVHGQNVRAHAFEYGGNTPSAGVERMWREKVLPHFYAPSTRQRTLESIVPAPLSIESELELDSPTFTPSVLADFQARGFERRNRWGK